MEDYSVIEAFLDASDEEVIAAAKAAHVHNFIMQQPGGYDMVLDEETSNISQGQKQLLTIARAILANNKILILDEATNFLPIPVFMTKKFLQTVHEKVRYFP